MVEFNELINNYLRRELKYKQIGRYYPSDCGLCIRKTWYSYKKPKDIDIEVIKIFEMGNMIHNFIVNVLESEKNPHIELIGSEVKVQSEIDDIIVSGRIDDIIAVKINGREYLVEVKSTSSLKHTKEANKPHLLQLQLYMHFKKIHQGIVLYVEKNTLQTRVFEVEYNSTEAEEAINRFRDLHKYLVISKLPRPEARINSNTNWQCKNCNYREECYKADPASEKLP